MTTPSSRPPAGGFSLTRLADTLDRTGSDFAVGAYVRLRPDADTPGYTAGEVQPWVTASTSPARARTTIAEHPAASGNIVAWSKVSRTEFWRRTALRFPVDRLYEDQVVAQRMYASARAFDVVPDVVALWRERADGSSITQGKASLDVLRDYLDGNYKLEGDLRREVAADIRRKVEIGSYEGLRHRRGLPVRGQRTKTNARTRKGPKRTVAGKKKAGRK